MHIEQSYTPEVRANTLNQAAEKAVRLQLTEMAEDLRQRAADVLAGTATSITFTPEYLLTEYKTIITGMLEDIRIQSPDDADEFEESIEGLAWLGAVTESEDMKDHAITVNEQLMGYAPLYQFLEGGAVAASVGSIPAHVLDSLCDASDMRDFLLTHVEEYQLADGQHIHMDKPVSVSMKNDGNIESDADWTLSAELWVQDGAKQVVSFSLTDLEYAAPSFGACEAFDAFRRLLNEQCGI